MAVSTPKTIDKCTVFELIEVAKAMIEGKKLGVSSGEEAREYALAVTALEDAQMRYTRGRARMLGVFRPVDLDSTDAIADRRSFLDDAEAARG